MSLSNLLQNYSAKLSDFGLAKDGPTGSDTHVSSRIMGTYGYAAPEYMATGNKVSGFRAIFSLPLFHVLKGLVLFTVL